MALTLKAVLGALIVVLIALLSKSKHYVIAGLVPLFPAFALIARYMVGHQRTLMELKNTLQFGMWSLLPYLVYLLSVYFFLDHLRLNQALIAGAVMWMVAAGVLLFFWT